MRQLLVFYLAFALSCGNPFLAIAKTILTPGSPARQSGTRPTVVQAHFNASQLDPSPQNVLFDANLALPLIGVNAAQNLLLDNNIGLTAIGDPSGISILGIPTQQQPAGLNATIKSHAPGPSELNGEKSLQDWTKHPDNVAHSAKKRHAPASPFAPQAQLENLARSNPVEAAAGIDGNRQLPASPEVTVVPGVPGNLEVRHLNPWPGNNGAPPLSVDSSHRTIDEEPPSLPGTSPFRKALAFGIVASVLAPILYSAAPPMMVLYTGPMALIGAVIFYATSYIFRSLYQYLEHSLGQDRNKPSVVNHVQEKPNLLGISTFFGLGFLLGLVLPGLPDLPLPQLGTFAGINMFLAASAFGMFAKMAQWGAAMTSAFNPNSILSSPIFQILLFISSGLLGFSVGLMPETLAGLMAKFIYAEFIAFSIVAAFVAIIQALRIGIRKTLSLIRTIQSLARGSKIPSLRLTWRKTGISGVGFALGVLLAILPILFMGRILEASSSAIVPIANVLDKNAHRLEVLPDPVQNIIRNLALKDRNMRIHELGPEFGEEAARIFSKNPRGALLLDKLRDRGGRLRLPKFFVVEELNYSMVYLPPLDAIFMASWAIENERWSIEEFLSDTAKQRQFLWEARGTVFHELMHAGMYRTRIFFPGQFTHFPMHLLAYHNIQDEFWAHVEDTLYIHYELLADPKAFIVLRNYPVFIENPEKLFDRIRGDEDYAGFVSLESEEHNRNLEWLKEMWPEISYRGHLLLAERYPDKAQYHLKQAEARKKEYRLRF